MADSKDTYERIDERIAAVGSNSIWVGDRIRLRGLEAEDAEEEKNASDSVDERSGWKIWPPRSSAAHRAQVDEAALAKPEGDAANFRLIIARRKDNRYVGSISTHGADPTNGTFLFGVGIGTEHKGKGYAAEAVLLVMRYMFEERRFQKCGSGVYGYNEPSLRLHRKLGFVEEGRVRRHIYSGGEYHDVVLFGMTVEEYRERYPRLRPKLL